jgi:hypothetical protein
MLYYFVKGRIMMITFCKIRQRNAIMPKKISTKYQHNNTIITPSHTPVCHRPCPAPPFPIQRPIFAAGIPPKRPAAGGGANNEQTTKTRKETTS